VWSELVVGVRRVDDGINEVRSSSHTFANPRASGKRF